MVTKSKFSLKGRVVTGDMLHELLEKKDIAQLDAQSMIGLYAATMVKLKDRDSPINRIHCPLIRFIANNYPNFYREYSVLNSNTQPGLHDLIKAYKKSKITIDNCELDITTYRHLGLLLFRSYGSARQLLMGQSVITLPLGKWISHIVYCLENNMPDLIEEVIIEEAKAHSIPLKQLLQKAWPPLTEGEG